LKKAIVKSGAIGADEQKVAAPGWKVTEMKHQQPQIERLLLCRNL